MIIENALRKPCAVSSTSEGDPFSADMEVMSLGLENYCSSKVLLRDRLEARWVIKRVAYGRRKVEEDERK